MRGLTANREDAVVGWNDQVGRENHFPDDHFEEQILPGNPDTIMENTIREMFGEQIQGNFANFLLTVRKVEGSSYSDEELGERSKEVSDMINWFMKKNNFDVRDRGFVIDAVLVMRTQYAEWRHRRL